MIFHGTELGGVFVLEPELRRDERGFFARLWCAEEFSARGLDARMMQASVSFNERSGTLRGMHLQLPPAAETKVVRCTAGAIFDVVVDLRPDSPTFLCWTAAELTARNLRALYIPEGCAHGFQTLAPASEVSYLISEFHRPELATGVRWNDDAFSIRWPDASERTISERDRSYPNFDEVAFRSRRPSR